MGTPARRLAWTMAILWWVFGVGGRAEASIDLQTPTGLMPGDHFRFVFVTDGTTDATSPDIAYYDNFVNDQASGATYAGNLITWIAIGSTSTVNAIDHVGISDAPVFLPTSSVEVTPNTTTTGLWSTTILHSIDQEINGQTVGFDMVWSGTSNIGTRAGVNYLGSPTAFTAAGFTSSMDQTWVHGVNEIVHNLNRVYGISEELTVTQEAVPEPSSLWMAGTWISAALAYGWFRHRRDQRGRRPVGPPDATE